MIGIIKCESYITLNYLKWIRKFYKWGLKVGGVQR